MEVNVLGPLEVRDDGKPVRLGPPKQRALLARLALDADHAVSLEQLIDDLWGEHVPATAVKMVQIYVSHLRKVLPDGVLQTKPRGYVFGSEGADLDLRRFERLRAEGRAALRAGDPATACERLSAALDLWRGASLAEFDEPFARAEGARLEELRVACLEEWLEAELAAGKAGDLVAQLEALVVNHPLRERLRAHLMLALYRSGRQADALAAYRDYRRMLDDELALEPSSELRELEAAILRQDKGLAVAPSPAPVAPRPKAARLIGRDPELRHLAGALAAARQGDRRAVFLTGEPGIGRRTLLESFVRAATGEDRLLVARGQSVDQAEAGEPYLAVLDALARLATGPDRELVTGILSARAPTWLAQIPWAVPPENLDRILERTRGATRERMLREMVEATEVLAIEVPLLIVLEDLHWADGATLALMRALITRNEPARLLIVGTYRASRGPSIADSIHRIARQLSASQRCEEIVVGPLDETAVEQYLAARLPDRRLPASVASVLTERTRGNPLFIRLLLDHWLSEGKPLDDLDALAVGVPDSLRELIEAALPTGEGSAEILGAASVVGSQFSVPLVAAMLDRPRSAVAEALNALTDGLQLVRAREPHAWPDGTRAERYVFGNDLCREVIYDSVPPDRRVALHRRAAAALQDAYEHRLPEVASGLAYHSLRGEDPRGAVRFLDLAAEQAFARNAHEEGIALLREGLSAAVALPQDVARVRIELELLSRLGQAVVAIDGWSAPEAEESLLRAKTLAEQLHDNEPAVSVLLALATLYELRGEFGRAEEMAAGSLALQPQAGGAPRLESHELLACNLFHQGSFTRSLEHADRGAALFEHDGGSGHYSTFPATLGDNAGVSCHDWAGLALWFLGRPDQALARARRALALAADPSRTYSLATARAQMAVLHQCRREPEAALEWAQGTIESASEYGYAYRVAMGRVLSGWAQACLGEPENGVEEIARGLAASRATGANMDDPHYLGLLAEAYLLAGEMEPGLNAVAEAFDIAARERSLFYEPELHRLRGLLLLDSDPDAAVSALLEALAVARRQASRSLELRAAATLSGVWRGHGRGAEARSMVAAVFDGFEEGFDSPDLIEAAALLRRAPSHR